VAISIDWANKIISVPQADCTLVSGTFYRLPTETVFRAAVNDLMDDDEGMAYEDPISHNTEYTVAGVTYARKIEIINGYSVQFTPDSQWSVELTESNNNLWDVENGILVQNQVQVIPTNTSGLISSPAISRIEDIVRGKSIVNRDTGLMEIYDKDGNLLFTAQIFEDAAGTQPYRGKGIDRRERFETP